VITASTGDDGYLNWDEYATREQTGSQYFEGASYPASSSNVVAVGGTSLHLNTGVWESETVWNFGGGGCSVLSEAPLWQRQVADWSLVGCETRRANADIAADANPNTGVNVYDSTPYPVEEKGKRFRVAPHWVPIGGTSVASPIIAAMFALAGGAKGVEHPAQTLYAHLGANNLHDVTLGGNGSCGGNYVTCSGSMKPLSPLDCGASALICKAAVGYDGPTGVGTPNGIAAFRPVEGSSGTEEPEEKSKEEPVEEPEEKPKEAPTEGHPTEPGSTSVLPTTPSTSLPSGTPESPATQTTAKTQSRKQPPRIAKLELTARARSALRSSAPEVSQIGFSFVLDRGALVHALLEQRVQRGRHSGWRVLPVALRFYANAGHFDRKLRGRSSLPPGLYRLVLSAAGGNSRSVLLHVR
jgi:hypothetical protein